MLRDRLFERRDREAALLAEVYAEMNGEAAPKLFYGGPEGAAVILPRLRSILFGSGDAKKEELQEAAFFYTQVWIRRHGGFDPAFSTVPYIKEAMKKRFPVYSPGIVDFAVDEALAFIHAHEPELAEAGTRTQRRPLADAPESPEYREEYAKGYALFEEGKYAEAIIAYTRCLELEPGDVNARFEIAEACIKLQAWDRARKALTDTVPHIRRREDQAKLYRRLAFIEIEAGHFPLADGMLRYSLRFERSPLALNELRYIRRVTGKDFSPEEDEVRMMLVRNGAFFWPAPKV